MNNYEFVAFDFSNFNESDVREEVITPLLSRLGCRKGTSANIIREYSLNYPQSFLGRKKPSKDPHIRGRADYICEIDGKTRWVIEAKPPQEDINADTIEQAYTYANHPEIRAFYFCLVNGHKIVIYQTYQGPNACPVLELNYENLEENFQILKNILSPDSICRDIPIFQPDTGIPLGEGLKSVVKLIRGSIKFTECDYSHPIITELTWVVTGGSITRDAEGKIIMLLHTATPFVALNEDGVDRVELFSADSSISNDSTRPTLFLGQISAVYKAGEKTINPSTLRPIGLPHNISATSEIRGKCFMSDKRLTGEFLQIWNFGIGQNVRLKGECEIDIL
jgi:hypothetical protein